MAKGAQEIAREAAARAVVPGAPKQDWNNWVPKTNKPRVQQLVSEIISRSANLEQNKRPKPSAWTGQKCLEWLQTHGLDGREVAAGAGADAPAAPAPGAGGVEGAGAGAKRWSARSHVPLLVNLIVANKAEFLERDRDITRQELDGKEHGWFWKQLAVRWNNVGIEDQRLLTVSADDVDFSGTNINAERRGLEVDAKYIRGKFSDVRRDIMLALANHSQSGGGDGRPLTAEEQRDQTKVYSSRTRGAGRRNNCAV